MTVHTRHEDLNGQFTERRTERPDLEPAILIIGSCRGEAFAPAEFLICADTLEGGRPSACGLPSKRSISHPQVTRPP
jgi:hypothetical protein